MLIQELFERKYIKKMTDTNEIKNEQQTQTETTGQPVDDMNRGIGTRDSEKLAAVEVDILEPKIKIIPPYQHHH